MLGYVYDHNEEIAAFAAALIPECHGRPLPKASTSIGVIDEAGHLIAGFVYHNYQPETGVIEMSIAAVPGKQWLTRETIRRMFEYPFFGIGCQMVVARVAADNERLLRQMAALGYAFIKIPRLLGRDRDAVLCLLTFEDWVDNRFSHRLKRSATGAEQPFFQNDEAA
jgi:RimJ/RimL family protein N-acetyltransferase